MKSTNNMNKLFSMDDFEKGLMLAGYITPNSISEIHERNALEDYEKELGQEKSHLYFKRVVLAAEIANKMYSEPTFGHVKFQKLIFLCENTVSMNINAKYSKQAAGPFDRKFMHTIDKDLKRQKWFQVEKVSENNIQRYKYTPLDNLGKYKQYYESYYKDVNDKIQYVLDLFLKQKTDAVEIVATIYACLIELKQNDSTITEDSLLHIFYSWSEEKKKFNKEQIISSWNWMKEKELIPTLR